jgi:hypothetical protein
MAADLSFQFTYSSMVLAWEKRPEFFTCYDAILEYTQHFVPMFLTGKFAKCAGEISKI